MLSERYLRLAGIFVVAAMILQPQGQQGLIVQLQSNGTTIGTAAGLLRINCIGTATYTANTYNCSPNGRLPSGGIMIIAAGGCPAGFSEVPGFNGQTPLGTIAANSDIGTTGGSATITPVGTNSTPVLAMNSYTPGGSNGTVSFTPAGTTAWPLNVPLFSGNGAVLTGSVAAPVFTGNAGTVPAQTISWPTPVPVFTGNAGTVPAQTFTGSSATTSSVSAGTPAGTNTAGTISWPAGVPTIAAGTFTQPTIAWPTGGSSVPTFSGASGTTSSVTGGTPAGTNASGSFSEGAISWPAGVPTFAGSALATHTHNAGSYADATSGTGVKLFTTSSLTASAATLSGTSGATSAGTPAGTVAWPAGVPTIAAGTFTQPTFTGSALAGHTHTLTPTGTVAWPTPVPTAGSGAFVNGAISWPVGVPTVTADTFSGTTLAGHTHTLTAAGTNGTASFTPAGTVAWPTGAGSVPTNSTASFTPAGTNSTPALTMNSYTPAGTVAWPVNAPSFAGNAGTVPAQLFTGNAAVLTGSVSAPGFTGNAFDPHSPWLKVIFCQQV